MTTEQLLCGIDALERKLVCGTPDCVLYTPHRNAAMNALPLMLEQARGIINEGKRGQQNARRRIDPIGEARHEGTPEIVAAMLRPWFAAFGVEVGE